LISGLAEFQGTGKLAEAEELSAKPTATWISDVFVTCATRASDRAIPLRILNNGGSSKEAKTDFSPKAGALNSDIIPAVAKAWTLRGLECSGAEKCVLKLPVGVLCSAVPASADGQSLASIWLFAVVWPDFSDTAARALSVAYTGSELITIDHMSSALIIFRRQLSGRKTTHNPTTGKRFCTSKSSLYLEASTAFKHNP
jgi:hypothetical protein